MKEQFEQALIDIQKRINRGESIHVDELDRFKLMQRILADQFEAKRSANAKNVTPKGE